MNELKSTNYIEEEYENLIYESSISFGIPSNGPVDMDFQERSKAVQRDVTSILNRRLKLDGNSKERVDLAVAEIGLLFAQRECELMSYIKNMVDGVSELGEENS